jgi:hypothetical protein
MAALRLGRRLPALTSAEALPLVIHSTVFLVITVLEAVVSNRDLDMMAHIHLAPSVAARSNRGYPLKAILLPRGRGRDFPVPATLWLNFQGTPVFRICRAPPSYGYGNGVYSDGNEDGASAPFRSRRRP